MPTQVAKDRQIIFEEEVSRNSGVSESLGKKLGGITNFINQCQLIRDDFKANGPYRLGTGSCTLDGMLIFPTNVELVFIAGSNGKVGLSGETEWTINWFSAPGVNEGSIFSTNPKFNTSSGNNAYFLQDAINNTNVVTTTGITLPVITKTKFLQGQAIEAVLLNGMSGAKDAQINFFYRPVN